MLGSSPRAPIAARFTSPLMAMHNVDESGFVGATFWESAALVSALASANDVGSAAKDRAAGEAVLRAVAMTALAWLQGTHLVKDGAAGGA